MITIITFTLRGRPGVQVHPRVCHFLVCHFWNNKDMKKSFFDFLKCFLHKMVYCASCHSIVLSRHEVTKWHNRDARGYWELLRSCLWLYCKEFLVLYVFSGSGNLEQSESTTSHSHMTLYTTRCHDVLSHGVYDVRYSYDYISKKKKKYIRLLNHKWQIAHVYNQSTSYTKYGPPAQHTG